MYTGLFNFKCDEGFAICFFNTYVSRLTFEANHDNYYDYPSPSHPAGLANLFSPGFLHTYVIDLSPSTKNPISIARTHYDEIDNS